MKSDGQTEEPAKETPRSPRSRSKLPTARYIAPREGTRFPSEVLGDNVRLLRERRGGLSQVELAKHMEKFGFAGWSRTTVSKLERGVRATSVDELFALASVFKVHIVNLVDPKYSGTKGTGIDLGFALPEGSTPEEARGFIMDPDDPWKFELGDESANYERYRKSLMNVGRDRFDLDSGTWD